MGKHLLDIIIVNYNSTDYLTQCIASIYSALNGLKVTIWVQDNNSTDNPERIRDKFPEVAFEKNRRNIGFAAANNKALNKSSAPYIMLLNPDCIVSKGFFKSTLSFMEGRHDVGITGPKILESNGSVQGSARLFPTPLTAFFGRSSIFTKHFPNNSISKANILTSESDGLTPLEVDWVSGACMTIRREAFRDVGLMDDRFFLYWEDADWCYRMWEKGWKVIYFPQACICHYAGKSSDNRPLPSIYHFHRSSYILHEKYTEFPYLLFNPLVLLMLAFRGIIAALIDTIKRKKISNVDDTKI